MAREVVEVMDASRRSESLARSTAQPALRAREIVKVFPGTRALDHVGFTVMPGEIHGLCGGNGCGKSTMIKILSGILTADAGTIEFGGTELAATTVLPEVMRTFGIRVVHQDLALFPDLSIAENLTLGGTYPTSSGVIRWPTVRRRAQEVLDRFEIQASPATLLRRLPVGARTQIAIARAMQDIADEQAILILDEPTAALPVDEVDELFAGVRRLAEQGHGVVFVSHRLDEVLRLTDRVTVMRDGRVVAEHLTSALTEQELIESILGRRANEVPQHVADRSSGRAVLEISGLDAGPLQDVDLEVKEGEVVGLAGLLGSGRTELLRAIYGDLRRTAGVIKVNGRAAEFRHMEQAIAAGVVMVPEDRINGAILPDMSVDENMGISVLREYWRLFGFRRTDQRRDASALREQFRVKSDSGAAVMKSLSGGNQQKAIMARWLRRNPVLLLLDEPTHGVDVGARADIYAAIRSLLESNGGAALVVTSDLEEMAHVVDRAVILQRGRIVANVPRSALTAQHLNEMIYAESKRA